MKPWIKRSLIALTGITIAVGGLTACGTRGHHEHGPMSAERMTEMRGKVIERVTKKLELSAEQQQKLGVLADKLQAQRTAFIGQTADGRTLRASVKGDRDPGYGSTCKLISETALCLARETSHTTTPGGVWTPGAAMGLTLVRRLQAHAGLSFQIVEEPMKP